MMTAATAATAANGSRNEEATVSFGRDQLKAFIERIERLEEEKKALSDDIRDVYAEAKGTGFGVKALRGIVRKYPWHESSRCRPRAGASACTHVLTRTRMQRERCGRAVPQRSLPPCGGGNRVARAFATFSAANFEMCACAGACAGTTAENHC